MRTKEISEEQQQRINARLWQFIERKGGVSEVSAKLGVVKQTLYNIRDNRTFPSAGTLALLRAHYPGTDLNWILSLSDLAIESNSAETALQAEIAALREQLASEKQLSSRLQLALLKTSHPEIFSDRDPELVKWVSESLHHGLTLPVRQSIGFHA